MRISQGFGKWSRFQVKSLGIVSYIHPKVERGRCFKQRRRAIAMWCSDGTIRLWLPHDLELDAYLASETEVDTIRSLADQKLRHKTIKRLYNKKGKLRPLPRGIHPQLKKAFETRVRPYILRQRRIMR